MAKNRAKWSSSASAAGAARRWAAWVSFGIAWLEGLHISIGTIWFVRTCLADINYDVVWRMFVNIIYVASPGLISDASLTGSNLGNVMWRFTTFPRRITLKSPLTKFSKYVLYQNINVLNV